MHIYSPKFKWVSRFYTSPQFLFQLFATSCCEMPKKKKKQRFKISTPEKSVLGNDLLYWKNK